MPRTLVSQFPLIDQANNTGGLGIGFGQLAGVRYRGQAFVPTQATLNSVAIWYRSLGTTDTTVTLTAIDAGNLPTGVALYTWTIPNSQLQVGLTTYPLPTPYTGLTPGSKYGVYLAPTVGGTYTDDYHDLEMSNTNPYAPADSFKYESGAWARETGLDWVFATGYPATRTLATARALTNARTLEDTLPAAPSAYGTGLYGTATYS